MQITDTIADLLTRIRNANSAKHETVDIPASNMKKAIVDILRNEGYIKNYTVIGFPSPACGFTAMWKICLRCSKAWALRLFLPLRAL